MSISNRHVLTDLQRTRLLEETARLVKEFSLTAEKPGTLHVPYVNVSLTKEETTYRVKGVLRSFGRCGHTPLVILEVGVKSYKNDVLRINNTSFIVTNGVINEVYACDQGWDVVIDVLSSITR